MGYETQESVVTELKLHIENTREILHGIFQDVCKQLIEKKRKGVFNLERSIKSWERVTDAGSKSYSREFGCGSGHTFDKEIRRMAAIEYAEWFDDVYETCPTDIPGYTGEVAA